MCIQHKHKILYYKSFQEEARNSIYITVECRISYDFVKIQIFNVHLTKIYKKQKIKLNYVIEILT